MRSSHLDINNELCVYRYGSGVKLVKPPAKNKKYIATGRFTQHTVSSLLKLPFSIYFDNVDGVIQQLNEHNTRLCGFDSPAEAIGQTYFDRFASKTADSLLKNDTAVMKQETIQIFEEDIQCKNNDDNNSVLSLKMPWYGNENKVIGLFGCSIVLEKGSLARSLTEISKMGLLDSTNHFSSHIGTEIDNIYLSKQQRICATYLLKGMSVKEIALSMNLSPRTVESYIDNLKSKFLCCNKVELILKLSEILI